MTNAEKYQEVFGFPPDRGNCPTEDCKFCPANPCADKGFSVVLLIGGTKNIKAVRNDSL